MMNLGKSAFVELFAIEKTATIPVYATKYCRSCGWIILRNKKVAGIL